MNVVMHPLSYYVDRLSNGQRFSQGRYGDGEWLAIFGKNTRRCNAEGTVYTEELCEDLRNSLRFHDEGFLFSLPEVLKRHGDYERRIDEITDIDFVDCDVWDYEVRTGGFCPLIEQLQQMKTCIISNSNLRRLHFLKYDAFVEIPYPNCHTEIGRIVSEAIDLGPGYVYLISAGLPATNIAQKLHAHHADCYAIDIGSVWDAFVGIGGQRGWRHELYTNKTKYRDWLAQYERVGVNPDAV